MFHLGGRSSHSLVTGIMTNVILVGLQSPEDICTSAYKTTGCEMRVKREEQQQYKTSEKMTQICDIQPYANLPRMLRQLD